MADCADEPKEYITHCVHVLLVPGDLLRSFTPRNRFQVINYFVIVYYAAAASYVALCSSCNDNNSSNSYLIFIHKRVHTHVIKTWAYAVL